MYIYIVIMMMNQWIWGYVVFRQSQWHTDYRGMIPTDALSKIWGRLDHLLQGLRLATVPGRCQKPAVWTFGYLFCEVFTSKPGKMYAYEMRHWSLKLAETASSVRNVRWQQRTESWRRAAPIFNIPETAWGQNRAHKQLHTIFSNFPGFSSSRGASCQVILCSCQTHPSCQTQLDTVSQSPQTMLVQRTLLRLKAARARNHPHASKWY